MQTHFATETARGHTRGGRGVRIGSAGGYQDVAQSIGSSGKAQLDTRQTGDSPGVSCRLKGTMVQAFELD